MKGGVLSASKFCKEFVRVRPSAIEKKKCDNHEELKYLYLKPLEAYPVFYLIIKRPDTDRQWQFCPRNSKVHVLDGLRGKWPRCVYFCPFPILPVMIISISASMMRNNKYEESAISLGPPAWTGDDWGI